MRHGHSGSRDSTRTVLAAKNHNKDYSVLSGAMMSAMLMSKRANNATPAS